jgi:hypothetical protein
MEPRTQETLPNTEKENIAFIKTNLRYKRTFNYYSNFFIYIFPLFFIISGLMIFYFGRLKAPTGQTMGAFLPTLIVTFGIAFFVFTYRRLKAIETFESIPITRFDLPTVESAIKRRFRTDNISFTEELGVLHIQTKTSLFSWGENITIIKDQQALLINSRPASAMQPVTIIKDKKNIEILKEIIQQTCC